MSRSIKFNISADVDTSELNKLTKSLNGIKKNIASFEGLDKKIVDPQTANDVRKVDNATSKLAETFTSLAAAQVKNIYMARDFGRQASISIGQMSKSTREGLRNLEEVETAFKLLKQDISKIDQVTRKMKLFPDNQKRAIEEATKATQKFKDVQAELNRLQASGKTNTGEYKRLQRELASAARELEKSADGIDKLDKEFGDLTRTIRVAETQVERMNRELRDMDATSAPYEEMKKAVDQTNTALKSARNVMSAFDNETISAQSSLSKMGQEQRETARSAKQYSDALKVANAETEKLVRSSTRDVGMSRGQLGAASRAITTQKEEYAKLSAAMMRTSDAAGVLNGVERRINEIMSKGTVSIREQVLVTNRLSEARKELNRSQSTLRGQDARLSAEMEKYADSIDKARASLRALGTMGVGMARGSSEWRANREEMQKASTAIKELQTAMTALSSNQARTKAALRDVSTEIDRLDNNTAEYKNTLQSIKGVRSVWESMLAPIRSIINVAKQLADVFGKTVTNAINVAVRAMRGISSSAGSIFSGLQRALQGTGSAFNRFGTMVQNSMNKAKESMLAVTAAGYALMSIGSQVQMFGNMAFRRMGSQLDEYTQYERTRIQAAIAATEMKPGQPMVVNNDLIDDIIFDMQRGSTEYSPEWQLAETGGKPIPVTFSAQELAQGMYYYSAAVGQEITQENAAVLMPTISTIMQMAKVTNTELESAIKGVMNIAMEFGYDPRADTGEAGYLAQAEIQKITAQVGYLANISTMEVEDIVQMFKMVGPMANLVAGGEKGDGLEDTMMLAFMASEVGLRGGNVGRGVQQLFTSLLDPTNKMLQIMGKYFNEGEAFSQEDYEAYFFKDGALEGGIMGFFQKLASKGLKGTDLAQMVAEMFTNNATRASIGPILGLDEKKLGGMDWEEFMKGWDENPLRWLAQATAETANSVSGWLDYMKNAWFQFTAAIITSIKGPLTGGFRVIGELLFELASFIKDTPAVGRVIAGIVTAISALASIGGTAIIAAGGLMILSRTLLSLGGGLSMFVRFMAMGALSLGIIIPAVLAFAVAFGVLSKLWQRDVLGMRSKWEEFTGSLMSKNYGQMFAGLSTSIEHAGAIFDSFIEGVIFGNQKELAAFAKWMERAFGPKFARSFLEQLQRINPALDKFQSRLRELAPSYKEGVADLNDYQTAFRGFLEQIVYGSMSVDAAKSISDIGSAFGMAPGELRAAFNNAADSARTFLIVMYSVGSSIVGIWKSISAEIYNNLKEAFNISSIEDFAKRLTNFAEGLVVGISSAIVIVLRVIERITAGVASLSKLFRNTEDDTNRLSTAFRTLGVIIGLALGARFAMAFAPVMGVIRFLIPTILNLTGLFVGLAGKILVAATNLGIFVAQQLLLASRALVVGTLQVAFNLLTGAISAASLGLTGFLSLGAGIVLIGAWIVGAAYAWLAFTQGVGEANRIVGGFLRGLWEGLQPGIAALKIAIGVIASLIKILASLSKALTGGASDAEALGKVIGLLISAAGIGGLILIIGRIIASLRQFGLALSLMGISGPLAIGLVVAAFLASTGAFDTVFSALGKIIDQLNKIQIAGVGAGDALAAIGVGAASTKTGRGLIARGAKWATRAAIAAPTPVKVAGLGIYGMSKLWNSRNNQIDDLYGTSDNDLQIEWGQSAEGFKSSVQAHTRVDNPNNVYNRGYTEEQGYNYMVMAQISAMQQGDMPLPGAEWSYENGMGNWEQALSPEAQKWVDAQEVTGDFQSMFLPGAGNTAVTRRSRQVKQNNKPAEEEGKSQAQSFSDGFVGFLRETGMYDYVLGVGQSLFGADFKFSDLNPMQITGLMNDLSSVPEISEEWEKFAKLDTLPGGKEYKSQLDAWEEYNAQIKTLVEDYGYTFEDAKHAIDAEYWQAGISIPIDPGTIDDAIAAGEAAEDLAKKLEEAKAAWNEAAQGWVEFSTPELFGALYDPLAGESNKSLVSWMSGEGYEAVMANVPEGTAPWMNNTEFMADFALGGGMNFAGEGVYGQNLHTLLKDSGALDALSAQTGIPVDVLLVGVPKFQAPEQFQASAMNDMVNIIDGLRTTFTSDNSAFGKINVAEFLDTKLGTDFIMPDGTTATQVGIDWAELNNYAIGKAIAGQDWNLADYIAESWDISIEEANNYLRNNHGLDPDVINSGMYDTVRHAVLSNQGAYNVLTQEMSDWLQGATNNFSTNVIEMTEAEFMAMDDATKAILTRMGYTFVINDYVPPEALAKAKADLDNLRQTIRTNLDLGNYEMVAPGVDGIMDGVVEDWTEISRVWSDAHQDYMVTVEDINGTQIVIPAAHYDAYLESLAIVDSATKNYADNLESYWDAYTEARDRALSGGATPDFAFAYGTGAGMADWAGNVLKQGSANAALGIPDKLSVKVDFQVSEIPEADISAALGVPMTDGAGSVKIDLVTEGFSEAQEAARTFKNDLDAIATTPVNVKINVDIEGMPGTGGGDFIGPAAPAGMSGLSIPITVEFGTASTMLNNWMEGVRASHVAIPVYANISTASTEINTWTAGVESSATATISIDADLAPASASIDTYLNVLLPTREAKIAVTIDTAATQLAVDTLNTSLTTMATTWTGTVTVLGTDTAAIAVGNVNGLAKVWATAWVGTVTVLGTTTAINMIQGVLNKVEEVAKTWTVTVNVSVNGSSAVSNLAWSLGQLPSYKSVTVDTFRNTYSNNFGPTVATGGRIGSAGMLGRNSLSFGANGLVGQYAGIVGRATGGRTQRGELTLVGEQGPELVGLSTGSMVMTAHETERLFRESQQGTGNPLLLATSQASQGEVTVNSDQSITLNFNGDMHFGNEASAREFFNELDRRSGREFDLARRGMRPVSEHIT